MVDPEMPRRSTGPLASVVIIMATALLFFLDRRRRRRGQRLNRNDQCARCGVALGDDDLRVSISGGSFNVWRGRVCRRCHERVRLQERLVWFLIGALLVAVLVLAWWSAHL